MSLGYLLKCGTFFLERYGKVQGCWEPNITGSWVKVPSDHQTRNKSLIMDYPSPWPWSHPQILSLDLVCSDSIARIHSRPSHYMTVQFDDPSRDAAKTFFKILYIPNPLLTLVPYPNQSSTVYKRCTYLHYWGRGNDCAAKQITSVIYRINVQKKETAFVQPSKKEYI